MTIQQTLSGLGLRVDEATSPGERPELAYLFADSNGNSWTLARILAIAGTQFSGELSIEMNAGSAAASDATEERIRIDGEGNVGIGVVPTEKLEVNGTVKAGHLLTDGSLTVGGNAHVTALEFGDGTSQTSAALSHWTVTGSSLYYDSGNVGIGTVTPAALLHVDGLIKAQKYEGDGSSLTGVLRNTGGTVTGPLTIDSSLSVTGNVQARQLTATDSVAASSMIRCDVFRPSTNDWEIARNGEHLEIREPEQGGKVWIQVKDDQGLHLQGTPNLWVDGSVGIGIGSDRPRGRLEVESPWGDWIFLRQARATNGGGGFHIHNPWKDTDSEDRNRLEFGYRTASGNNLWGQMVLHGPTGNLGVGAVEPKSRLHINGGRNPVTINGYANTASANSALGASPNRTMIVGGPWSNRIYFYWKDQNGTRYYATLNGNTL
jgi:hypothetical protein